MTKKIVILNNQNRKSLEENELKLVNLKHPKTAELVPFLLATNETTLSVYELISYAQDTSSIFVDNYVQSDPSVYLASEFNLKYFLIDFVYNSNEIQVESIDSFKEKFLQNLLTGDKSSPVGDFNIPKLARKLTVINELYLDELFVIKRQDTGKNPIKIVFSKSKCIDWIKGKIGQLEKHFEKNESTESSKKSVKMEIAETRAQLDAFELVCQYISKDFYPNLRKELKLESSIIDETNKRPKNMVTID